MNDKDKKGFFIVIGDSKIYPEKFLPNPIGVCSYQAYGELKKLQAENKKLRKALEAVGYLHLSSDQVIKTAREALKEVGEE